MDNNIYDMANGDALSDGVTVHNGFPNPGADQRGRSQALALDLNRLLVKNPSSTFLFRINGHHWASQGIFDGDVAIIDRGRTPRTTDMVILWQGSGFMLRRHLDVLPDETIWGVITATVHQLVGG